MKFRHWLNIFTIILLALVVYFGWGEIVRAWGLLDKVNIWILLLIIPAQIFSYYATGEIIFSYLRSKGNLKDVSRWGMARIALELNFVNHILPSGGVAGFSYLGWMLKRHGVSVGRSTMAQIVRFAATFVSFVIFDQQIRKDILIVCAVLILALIAVVIFAVYTLGSRKRLNKFAGWLTRTVNQIVSFFTRGKKNDVLKLEAVEEFFDDIHQDYLEIRHDRKILIKPLLWSVVVNLVDVGLIWIAFMSLSTWVNPAILFIAYGLSSIVSSFSGTLGGTGVYEAIMVTFLASAGVTASVAIAGTLLARVILLAGTILFGYIFYQLTINKYGKESN